MARASRNSVSEYEVDRTEVTLEAKGDDPLDPAAALGGDNKAFSSESRTGKLRNDKGVSDDIGSQGKGVDWGRSPWE